MPIITLNLPEEAIRTVREQVGSGHFADENAVVYEAIRQLDYREYTAKEAVFRAAIEEGLDDLANGRCGPYTIEDLNRDMTDES